MTRIKLFLFLFLLSPCVFASGNVKYDSELKFGSVFLDSAGLNKITQGLNTSYGTNFGNIRFPFCFSGAFHVEFFRSRIGVELGYEYSAKSATSSLYGITEDVKYTGVPFSLSYQYRLFEDNRFKLFAGTYLGFMNVALSMSTTPSIIEADPYRMVETAFLLGTGLDLVTKLSKNIGILTSLSYRYAATPEFKYSDTTLRHNNGDMVAFSDGSTLTMNLSGIKFLIGVVFEWSQI